MKTDKSIMPKDPVKRKIWCLESQIMKDENEYYDLAIKVKQCRTLIKYGHGDELIKEGNRRWSNKCEELKQRIDKNKKDLEELKK